MYVTNYVLVGRVDRSGPVTSESEPELRSDKGGSSEEVQGSNPFIRKTTRLRVWYKDRIINGIK